MFYNTYFDMDEIKSKPELWICKPSRTVVGKLHDSYNVQYTVDAGAINKLTFTIPSKVERNHDWIVNPQVELIRERYVIKMKFQDKIEYFIVLKINKERSNDGFEEVSYQCDSAGYAISQQLVRDYDEVSKTLSTMATDMLAGTNWTLDYVDVDFDLKYRSYQTTSSNALQCIFDLCQKFNAVVLFDTVREKISFHKPENIGKNKGIVFREGVYLESFNLGIDPSQMVTRLSAFGQDGLEFRRLSPTGSNYIENYSFFMYPFECDANYNVIKKSKWMSDELCIAMIKYNKLLESKQGEFDNLVSQTATKNTEIGVVEQEISVLDNNDRNLKNQRDMINYTYEDKAPDRQEWKDIIAQINANQAQLDNKNLELSIKKAELQTLLSQIEALRLLVSVNNNFTPDEIKEWNKYIYHKEYFNDSIIDDKDLLEETEDVFKDMIQPPLDLNLSVENFLIGTEPNFDRKRLGIGDIVKLKSEDLGIYVKARIMQLVFNFDNFNLNINVSNTVREKDNMDKFIENMNLTTSTSTTVNNDKYKWNEGREAKDELTQYINNTLDTAKQLITGGMNNSVKLNERGLIAVDMENPNTWLMIQNGVLFITPDNGNSVSVAINKDGVHAERLVGRLILGNKLHIEDELGVVKIENGAVKTYDTSGALRTQLGRYPDPNNPNQFKYGLRIFDGAIDIRTNEAPNRGVQFDATGIRTFNNNGVRTFNVDSATGQVDIVGSLSIRTSYQSGAGVVIDSNGITGFMAGGGIGFQITNSGDATFGGRLTAASGSINNVTGSVSGLTGSVSQMTGDVLNLTGSINAMQGTFEGVVTGSLSAQTVSAIRINADQINALRITADMIDVTELSAISANIGTITAGTLSAVNLNGVNMNTDKDITVGNMIKMSGSGKNEINFGNGSFEAAKINGNTGLSLEASLGTIDLVSSEVNVTGTLKVNGKRVLTEP